MHPTASHQNRMVTRAQHGIFVPKRHFNLSATTPTISPLPHSYHSALNDPNWHKAMLEEYNALMTNNTWCLVPRPAGTNVITGKWIFRHKHNSDGSLARYKARWVVRGFNQEHGVDYDETFSPVCRCGIWSRH
jgi:histone deacetylase 1/2